MRGWCLACLVVLASSPQLHGGESAITDSKGNKQADAGRRLFSKAFFVRRIAVELFIISAEREDLSTQHATLYNGNVQQNTLSAASCVTKDLSISPRFSPKIFFRDANSVLLSTPLYTSSRLYALNSLFEIAHQESVKVFVTSTCEKQFMIDGCIYAARVTEQNI